MLELKTLMKGEQKVRIKSALGTRLNRGTVFQGMACADLTMSHFKYARFLYKDDTALQHKRNFSAPGQGYLCIIVSRAVKQSR